METKYHYTLYGFLIVLLILSAIIDNNIRQRHGISRSGHIKRALLRGSLMGLGSWALYQPDLYMVLVSFVFQASIWWLGFDMLMNALHGDALFKVGTTAFLDRIWHRITNDRKAAAVLQLVAKIAFLVTSGLILYV